MANEVEIKFAVSDLNGIRERLQELQFREVTPRTREMNTLYDRNGELRQRGEVLRIRKYGEGWKLTHKAKSQAATRHKTHAETETSVADGEALDSIFRALGFAPSFVYEKFRSEWTDGEGHVVLDETPIGNLGEIEGSPEWIDQVAARLGLAEGDYINKSYVELFLEWKKRQNSSALNMVFAEVEP
jgi:adenylate cyclase class 2